ncbi:hypothetical protein Q7C36_003353 [Tachysurus vachellii]|uniref:Uncharacterized protein n=1 Tax=Tachysurus vachellii TaxID=175792 RepID=A0AA88P3K7_TACVA|nr:hypothetical protein Q7C36_003353 [Tachysurus vachellii]
MESGLIVVLGPGYLKFNFPLEKKVTYNRAGWVICPRCHSLHISTGHRWASLPCLLGSLHHSFLAFLLQCHQEPQ